MRRLVPTRAAPLFVIVYWADGKKIENAAQVQPERRKVSCHLVRPEDWRTGAVVGVSKHLAYWTNHDLGQRPADPIGNGLGPTKSGQFSS